MALLMKIVLVGDGSVGKTSLRSRFMGQFMDNNYIQTIGSDLSVKTIKFNINGTLTSVQYQIWDLAGQEHFSSVRPIYYKGASGVILVYDVTNRTSFENVIHWLEEVKAKSDKTSLPLVILGNKIDLRNEVNTSISTSEGLLLAKRIIPLYYGNSDIVTTIPYFETSAKTGENVEPAFLKLADMVFQKSLNKTKEKRRFFI